LLFFCDARLPYAPWFTNSSHPNSTKINKLNCILT
jgi:hypothetical protein